MSQSQKTKRGRRRSGVTERAKSQSKTRSRSKIPQLVLSWHIPPPASWKKTEMYQILSQDWAWNSQVFIPKQTGNLFENSDRFTLRYYWDWSGVQSVLRRFVFWTKFQKVASQAFKSVAFLWFEARWKALILAHLMVGQTSKSDRMRPISWVLKCRGWPEIEFEISKKCDKKTF